MPYGKSIQYIAWTMYRVSSIWCTPSKFSQTTPIFYAQCSMCVISECKCCTKHIEFPTKHKSSTQSTKVLIIFQLTVSILLKIFCHTQITNVTMTTANIISVPFIRRDNIDRLYLNQKSQGEFIKWQETNATINVSNEYTRFLAICWSSVVTSHNVLTFVRCYMQMMYSL